MKIEDAEQYVDDYFEISEMMELVRAKLKELPPPSITPMGWQCRCILSPRMK